MEVSIIIPLFNEAESLLELHDSIAKVLEGQGFRYEIIWIDDGSSDNSWEVLKKIHQKNPNNRAIHFSYNCGKSHALQVGFERCEGEIVFTMDADLQDNPQEITAMHKMIVSENFDLVSGWKKERYDHKWRKNIPSKIFNWAARCVSGISLHDFNCGLKAYKKQVIKNIVIEGEMHRYIPILAKNAGFKRIGEKIVKHRPRKYGTTKFGMERFTQGFLDLITIWFVSKFRKRPMHFFGFVGIVMFAIGFAAAFCMGLYKLLCVFYWNKPTILITNNPWFYIALTTIILGTQLFLSGLLGEFILRNKSHRKITPVHKTLGYLNTKK